MPSELDARMERLLDGRRQKGRYRTLKQYDTSESSGLVDFSSNDYLSLTTSDSLRSAYLDRLQSTPQILGSTGSRLLSGCNPAHTALEHRLAAHFSAPSALLFNSGWDANVSFFSTVPQTRDWIVHDELIHASVHSGMRSSRLPVAHRLAFAHNDARSLARVLESITKSPSFTKGDTVFLAIESLYSMDGDFAPLPALLRVFDEHVRREQQCTVVDEAHSTGVYGDGGRGIVSALGLEHRVAVRLMTFGKGVGCAGAVLLSSLQIRSFLINFARPFIFSTAPPLSTVLALECAWDVLQSTKGDARRRDLARVVAHLHMRLAPLLAGTRPSLLRLPDETPTPFPSSAGLAERPHAPIVGLLTPTPHALSAFLLERGFVVRPVVPPTVPPGGERVRICLRAGVEDEVIDRLVRAIALWVEGESRERARL